jgi:hypothetical protein
LFKHTVYLHQHYGVEINQDATVLFSNAAGMMATAGSAASTAAMARIDAGDAGVLRSTHPDIRSIGI